MLPSTPGDDRLDRRLVNSVLLCQLGVVLGRVRGPDLHHFVWSQSDVVVPDTLLRAAVGVPVRLVLFRRAVVQVRQPIIGRLAVSVQGLQARRAGADEGLEHHRVHLPGLAPFFVG